MRASDFVLVPRDPSPAMLRAGSMVIDNYYDRGGTFAAPPDEIWEAMIGAHETYLAIISPVLRQPERTLAEATLEIAVAALRNLITALNRSNVAGSWSVMADARDALAKVASL